MKTIVYHEDGSIEATANHAAIVARGDARYATPEECKSYDYFECLMDREADYEAQRLAYGDV